MKCNPWFCCCWCLIVFWSGHLNLNICIRISYIDGNVITRQERSKQSNQHFPFESLLTLKGTFSHLVAASSMYAACLRYFLPHFYDLLSSEQWGLGSESAKWAFNNAVMHTKRYNPLLWLTFSHVYCLCIFWVPVAFTDCQHVPLRAWESI